MSELPMRGHFRYLRFKTFPMTPRTPQCEVFCLLLSSSKHSGVPEDSQPPTFPSVGLHPHTWPKWGCDKNPHHLEGNRNEKLWCTCHTLPSSFLDIYSHHFLDHIIDVKFDPMFFLFFHFSWKVCCEVF